VIIWLYGNASVVFLKKGVVNLRSAKNVEKKGNLLKLNNFLEKSV
jgi:hypothetical protein